MLKKIKIFYRKFKIPIWTGFGIFFIWYLFFSLPKPLFKEETSTLIYSADNRLLGATISDDEQWRFPANDSVPKRFEICITQFEDAYFRKHPGVNPVSIFRAFRQNLNSDGIVSGGSTITMQTIRLAKQNPKRTYGQKLLEIIQATRLELTNSKDKILNYYISHAPFGGNVVGLDAASWRYYAKSSDQLSWGESATLAVLPNAPSLIFPGKNQELLLAKRNRLLKKLWDEKLIKKEDYELALLEPLPGKPNALPEIAPHLLQTAIKSNKGKRLKTTLDANLQEQVNLIAENHRQQLSAKEIHNLAILVLEVKTGDVKAYVGNSTEKNNAHSNHVDIIQSERSSGSILKPFLYGSMIQEGKLLPKMLLPDTPMDITENYERNYSGAVPADEALAKSLNIPAVQMLKAYSVSKFHHQLKEFGFTTFTKTPKHYGLSLVVGGGEVSLWELAQAYRNLAYRVLKPNNYVFNPKIDYLKNKGGTVKKNPLNAQSVYLTINALQEVARPESETGWQVYSGKNIAWKTGTSHGFKDAWSVGMTPEYVVAVWVGNADGEGRPGIIGVKAAAPVMFDVFGRLKLNSKFKRPEKNWIEVKTCKESGFLWGENCAEFVLTEIPKTAENGPVCPYHQKIHLDKTRTYRVNNECYPVSEMITEKRFVLPPIEGYYYRKIHPDYQPVPDFMKGCLNYGVQNSFAFVYPKKFTQLYLPRDYTGEIQPVIFEIAYNQPEKSLFWYLDGKYVGTTQNIHKLALKPEPGRHRITVSDTEGNRIQKYITIVNKE